MKNNSRQSLSLARFRRTAVEALDDVDIGAADRIERTHLVLSVLERPLLMRGEMAAERLRHRLAEVGRRLQRKQPKSMAGDSFRRSGRFRSDCVVCRHVSSLPSQPLGMFAPAFTLSARFRRARQAKRPRRHPTAHANRRAAKANRPRRFSGHSAMPSA